jgi:hypothetical protein
MSKSIFAVLVDCKSCKRRFTPPEVPENLTTLVEWLRVRQGDQIACTHCGIGATIEAGSVCYLKGDLQWHRLDGQGI